MEEPTTGAEMRDEGGDPLTPPPLIPPTTITVIEGGLPVPVVKNPARGILGKICGEANEVIFIGFSDLFQQIVDFFIPNIFPLDLLESMFNDVFDNLQENMKPFAYNQGVAMGDNIEGQVEAWIKSKFDFAIDEIEALRDKALGEINTAKNELLEHTQKIQDLIDRVGKLESESGIIEELKQRLNQ